MKKTILFFSLLFITLGINAQSNDKFTGSLLWEISGKGLSKSSYILGTHHLIAVSFADSIPGLTRVINETQQVVGELPLSDEETAVMQVKIQENAMLSPEESYQTMLSETDYKALDETLKADFGAGLDQLGILKPGFLSTMYSVLLYAKSTPGFNPMTHEPIDKLVQRKATEEGKAVLSLETVEDQLYVLFDASPQKSQAEILACVVQNDDFTLKMLALLNDYYRKGDLNEMYKLSFENDDDPCPSSEEFSYAIAKERNDKWLDKLPKIMSGNSSLIAVGALHLAGEEGLLYQLHKMGYNVKPVKK